MQLPIIRAKNYFFLKLYLDTCFTNAIFLVTITISNFNNATNAFTGEATGPNPLIRLLGPVNGTVKEDCTRLITMTGIGSNIYFAFDSENCQLHLYQFGTFSEEKLFLDPLH